MFCNVEIMFCDTYEVCSCLWDQTFAVYFSVLTVCKLLVNSRCKITPSLIYVTVRCKGEVEMSRGNNMAKSLRELV